MRIIAVCGIGSPLGARLLARFDQDENVERIIGVDTHAPAGTYRKLAFHKVEPTGRYETLFADEGVTNAVHIGLDGGETFDRLEDYTRGFDAFFKATTVAGCQTLTLLSTIFGYGAHVDSNAVLFEGSSLRPTSFLGEAARMLEMKSYEYVHTFPDALLQIVRAAFIVGPTSENFLNRCLRRKAMVFSGPAELAYQFVHEDDAARALHLLSASEKTGVFNLAADSALTMEQVAQLSEVRLTYWPTLLVRMAAAIGRGFKIKNPPWFPVDAIQHTLHQTLVTNVKFRHEIYFDFLYTGPEAFLESLMDPDPDDDRDERFLDELVDDVPDEIIEEAPEEVESRPDNSRRDTPIGNTPSGDLLDGEIPEEEDALLRSSAEDALEAAREKLSSMPSQEEEFSHEDTQISQETGSDDVADSDFVDELPSDVNSSDDLADGEESEVGTDSEMASTADFQDEASGNLADRSENVDDSSAKGSGSQSDKGPPNDGDSKASETAVAS